MTTLTDRRDVLRMFGTAAFAVAIPASLRPYLRGGDAWPDWLPRSLSAESHNPMVDRIGRIFVDGKHVGHECFFYDVDRGFAKVWQQDENGNLVTAKNALTGKYEHVPKVIRGRVTVEAYADGLTRPPRRFSK